MERSNGSKSLFALDPRTGWQKNASRREVRGVHNRSGVYPDPSNCRDRLLCSVPTTERQWMATTFLLVYQRSRPAARRFIALHGMPFFVVSSNMRYHPKFFSLNEYFYLKFRPRSLIASETKNQVLARRISNYYETVVLLIGIVSRASIPFSFPNFRGRWRDNLDYVVYIGCRYSRTNV